MVYVKGQTALKDENKMMILKSSCSEVYLAREELPKKSREIILAAQSKADLRGLENNLKICGSWELTCEEECFKGSRHYSF